MILSDIYYPNITSLLELSQNYDAWCLIYGPRFYHLHQIDNIYVEVLTKIELPCRSTCKIPYLIKKNVPILILSPADSHN